MKIVKSIVLISTLVIVSSAAVADERGQQGMGPMGQSSGMMMQGGGMGMMDMDRAQDRIKSMQQLMDRMHQTTDSGKRQKLLREHMEEMQKLMGNMRGMMMGPGMKGGGSMSMEDRQKLMGQRLDIMQQMMEQMLEQQSQMMK
jgi:hypothetical protein